MRRIVPIRYILHAMRARGREYGTHALTLPVTQMTLLLLLPSAVILTIDHATRVGPT